MSLPRRRLLGWLGAAGVGAAAGVSGVRLAERSPSQSSLGLADEIIPFHGPYQAGITTPRQPHVVFAAFDVVGGSVDDLRALLRFWTGAAARMTEGAPAAPPSGDREQVPWDTGEATGLGSNRLTLTFGVGPTLFVESAHDRFGLASRRPGALVELPSFETDDLDPSQSGGDLCIQACADDEQVAFHAVRELLRLGHGIVSLRWSQAGFLPRVPDGVSPRNLLGFRDGTNNIRGDDVEALERFVWVASEGPSWLQRGSFLVARRINIRIDEWDGSSLAEQEAVIGRSKMSGAPPNRRDEHDAVDLAAVDVEGIPIIAPNAHIRVSAPESNGGARILRRSYSFVDRSENRLEAGLLFLAYQRDPRTQFVPIQRRLARIDALNRYTRHTGSAVFAMFPGIRRGGILGEGLLQFPRPS
jgi:deferrochelatase/peroxidase EfeB